MNAAIPIVIAVVTALVGFLTWLLQRRVERRKADRLRKEALYEKLLEAITELSSFGNGAPVLIESQKAWLYASDDVLRAVTNYLKVFLDEQGSTDVPITQEQRAVRQRQEGAIRLAIRRDLERSTTLDENWMSNEWKPVASSEEAIREYLARRR